MKRYLHFVCPGDFIESAIRTTFKGAHYFITSLGNSMKFSEDRVLEVIGLAEAKRITEICFVLADDNRFVSDAMGNKQFSSVRGMRNFYRQLGKRKEFCQLSNRTFFISSFHLHKKVHELKQELSKRSVDHLKIRAKIYNRKENIFQDIYPDLVLNEFSSLN